jgi:hypothetical protein
MADAKLVINGREYDLPSDPNKLPLGDARAIKKITGLSIARFYQTLADDPTDGDCLAAFVYILMRRENPLLTIEDVEQLSFGALEWKAGDDEEDDVGPPEVTSPPSSPEGSGSPESPPAAGEQNPTLS